jgi:type IV fimbrial biogenesis protein FimT
MPLQPRQPAGFTLVELLIAIAIAAIVVTMAVPGMRAAVSSTRLTGYSNQLVGDLSLARSEAVKRGRRVVVERTGANWENGWRVFVDTNGDGDFDDDGDTIACEDGEDCVLAVTAALAGGYTLRSALIDAAGNTVTSLFYRPSGLGGASGSFALCDNGDGDALPQAGTARLVLVNRIGRVRMAGDADGNGVPENDDVGGAPEMTSCTPPFSP